jgi:hypothetical protein
MVHSWSSEWFLETLSKEDAAYLERRMKREEGDGLVFKGLKRVTVNYTFWKSIDPMFDFSGFIPYTSSSYPNHPNLLDYMEATGNGHAKIVIDKKSFVEFQHYDTNKSILIPFEVIVNVSSAGFPKVCYLPDRYLTFFVKLTQAFETALHTKTPIVFDERYYLIENITPYLYHHVASWNDLFNQYLRNPQPRIEVELHDMLKTLYTLIGHRLFLDCKQFPSSIFHGCIDVGIDEKFINADNPIAKMYREKYKDKIQRFKNS